MKPPGKKQTNRSRIYQLVYQAGSISRPEIALRLGISLPTAIQNVKCLQADGLLEEGDLLESTGGRKATAVHLSRNARFAVGVDITRNHLSVVLINLAADIVGSRRVKQRYEDNAAYYRQIVGLINEMIASAGIAPNKILGAGFSVPAILSENGRLLVYSRVLNVPVLHCSTISRGLAYESVMCNDANAAGIAELWRRKDLDNAVYLSLSNSVGGAILLHNELYSGENQRGGEFGHSTLVRDGRPCYCGRLGCMDAYCSAEVLSRHTGGCLPRFFEKLSSGDPAIAAVWDEYSGWLAVALNNIIASFDCKVILGGYLGEYLESRLDDIKRRVATLATFSGTEDYVTPCVYKKEASAVGAALLYVRSFLQSR
ncbi:MAG: ROK family transcriptional regulator [Spirochaetaceae bacterium]|nr:ROK family transcriptional regulator [Spirochaetaceae bacterium]